MESWSLNNVRLVPERYVYGSGRVFFSRSLDIHLLAKHLQTHFAEQTPVWRL